MAGEPRSGFAHPGPKRPQDATIFRVDKSKETPLLINQVPAKSLRTHLSPRVKNTYSPYKACRDSRLPLGQRKSQTEELDSIRRELSKIKAQVDSLLKSLESMEEQRAQHTGQVLKRVPRPLSQWVPVFPVHWGFYLCLSLTVVMVILALLFFWLFEGPTTQLPNKSHMKAYS
ncbi:uncharacterized protein [Alexandromys fortis]|nr:uncharacterized protein LOC126502541 isoform X2 [Microtus fortis]